MFIKSIGQTFWDVDPVDTSDTRPKTNSSFTPCGRRIRGELAVIFRVANSWFFLNERDSLPQKEYLEENQRTTRSKPKSYAHLFDLMKH